jgi:hypothetical protein
MTMRDRILAVIHGREHDRVPFCQYEGVFPTEELWEVVGRGNIGLIRWSSVHATETPNCRFEWEEYEVGDRRAARSTVHTPAGSLAEERIFEPAYGSSSVRKHYVVEPEDYQVLLAYLRDTVVRENLDQVVRDREALGDDGIPMPALTRTPYQQLWVQWVGLEDLSLHMADGLELVEGCVAEMTRICLETYEAARSAAQRVGLDMIEIPDNVTAPAIGPARFRRYCVSLYDRLADMLDGLDVPVYVHMDGDLKPLWDEIGASKVGGLDSFSPTPDNDTSPADAVRLWPDMRLWLNFPSSVHIRDDAGVYAVATDILQQAGHTGRLQIQISENVPTGAWRTSYPAIARAIRDFTATGVG